MAGCSGPLPADLEDATENFFKAFDKYAPKLISKPEDVKKIASKLDELRDKNPEERVIEVTEIMKQLKLEADNHEMICSFVTNVLGLLHVALDIGAKVSSIACPPASVALSGSLIILETVSKMIRPSQKVFMILWDMETISFQARRVNKIEKLQKRLDIQAQSIESRKLLTAIVNYYTSCLEVLSPDWKEKLSMSSNAGEKWKQERQALSTAIYEFDAAIGDQNLELGYKTLQAIAQVISKRTGIDLIKTLRPSYAEVQGRLESFMNSYCQGTLHWLFSKPQLKSWLTEPNSPNILWLDGLPGIGKTMMASYIISKMISQGQNRYLMYFFCKHKSRRMTNAEHLVRTFSYQLALQIPEFYAQLNQLPKNEMQFDLHSGGIRLLYNQLIAHPLLAIANDRTREIYCIIDGLDQANFTNKDDATHDAEIVVLLNLLVQPIKSIKIRLLIISCHSNDVARAVSRLDYVLMQISRKDNSEDIRQYVEQEIKNNSELRLAVQKTKYDAKYLCDLATGNFLWIRLILQLLPTCYGTDDFEIALRTPPGEEFAILYTQILTKMDSEINPVDEKRLIRLFWVICSASREMRIEALRIAVDRELSSVERFQNWLQRRCGIFLQVDDSPGPKYVRIIHQSFITFLKSINEQNSPNIKKYQVQSGIAQAKFALLLLQYILEIDRPQLKDGKFVQRTEQDAAEIFNQYPLLKYAVDRWSYHLCRSEDPGAMGSLYEHVSRLLRSRQVLIWLEALGTFDLMTSLPKASRNLRNWSNKWRNMEENSRIPEELNNWARDLDRLYTDFGEIISSRPNSVHSLLFDIFPYPSLFDQFRNQEGYEDASLSHHLSQSWNPRTVWINYYTEYHASVVPVGQSVFAMAGIREIRVMHQTSGQTFRLFKPPDKHIWTVFAMSFNKISSRFASVHVLLPEGTNSECPYAPEIRVWDLNTSKMVVAAPLECLKIGDVICLVDRIEFSTVGDEVIGGGWKFNITTNCTTQTSMEWATFDPQPDALLFNLNASVVLRLEQNGKRVLVHESDSKQIASFEKLRYYENDTASRSKYSVEQPRDCLEARSKIAPISWLQHWREITRSYCFSPDSQWFVRFMEYRDNVDQIGASKIAVSLHGLRPPIVKPQIIYGSDDNYSDIFVNNIVFDSKSERVALTFDHIVSGKSYDTTVAFWDTKNECRVKGFNFGRYRFRELVQFSSDPKFLFMCRMGFSKWDIDLGRLQNSKFAALLNMGRLFGVHHSDWVIGHYVQGKYIRLNYITEDILAVCFLGAEPKGQFVVQIFGLRNGDSAEYRYGSELEAHLRYPVALSNNSFTLGDRIAQIHSSETVSIHSVNVGTLRRAKTTAFHLTACLMATVEETTDQTELLKLYKTDNAPYQQVSSTVLPRRISGSLQDDPLPFIIIFDSSQIPEFLFVLSSHVDERNMEPSLDGINDISEELHNETIFVYRFEMPSLQCSEEFSLANYWPRVSHFAWWKMRDGSFDPKTGKLICCGEGGDLMRRHIWIINTREKVGIGQSFSGFRWLQYIKERETVVAITEDRWIQSKNLRNMESEIAKFGEGRTFFDASINPWILKGWRRLTCIPPSIFPCWESGVTIYPTARSRKRGEIAFIGEFGKQLVQISFDWE